MSSSAKIFDELPQWQTDLIEQIATVMKDYYCLPASLSGSKEQIFKNSLIEAFKKVNATFSDKTTYTEKPKTEKEYQVFLSEINKTLENFDSHLHVSYEQKFIAERKSGEIVKGTHSAKFNFDSGPPQEVLLTMNAYRGKPENNYGFISQPQKPIPNDIGYIKINCLLDPTLGADEKEQKYKVGPHAVKAANDALQKLTGKKGIIIDLRDAEEGGSPEMVQYLISFFIKQKGLVYNEIEDRFTNTEPPYRTQYKVIDTPFSLYDVPVTILTDKTTFSAREEIAYDLQQLNIHLKQTGEQIGDRFTVIGDVTRGGAHPTRSFPLMNSSCEINKDVLVFMPYSESINPTSGTNWEKKGVQPDIQIKSHEDALDVALKHLRSVIPAPASTTTLVSKQMGISPSSMTTPVIDNKQNNEVTVTNTETAKSVREEVPDTAKNLNNRKS